jgi:CBS domain-containing protein
MFTARDIMDSNFHTLQPAMTVAQTIELFRQVSREKQRRVFGMIVVEEDGKLAGMLSMYDILLLVRPKHVQVWGTMTDIDLSGLLATVSKNTQSVQVADIMTTEVVTVPPDTHVMTILDIMIRRHIRRIPVVDGETIAGMVYLSDLFYVLVDRLEP